MGDVQGVPTSAFFAMNNAFARMPRNLADKFVGSVRQQTNLAAQMRGMFNRVPKADDEWLMFDRAGVLALAAALEDSGPRWSPGQYSAALASLIKDRNEAS